MNITARLILVGLVGAGPCLAQETQTLSTASRPPDIAARGPSLALAMEAAQMAIAACKALGANVSVSVVDSAGVLKLLLASDGTHGRGVTTSTRKAITAKDFNMPISELDKKTKTDAALAAKVKSNPDYLVGQGGFPLRIGDEVIGGIGVGGAPNGGGDPTSPEYSFPSRDEKCALAALNKIRAQLK